MSLEALLEILQEQPPVGAMPQLGVSCLHLAGRALEAPEGFDTSQTAEEERGARVDPNKARPAVALERLPAIQVTGKPASVGCGRQARRELLQKSGGSGRRRISECKYLEYADMCVIFPVRCRLLICFTLYGSEYRYLSPRQDLTARCLRMIFPASSLKPHTRTPVTRGAGVAGAAASAAMRREQRQRRGRPLPLTGTATAGATISSAEAGTAAGTSTACLASASAVLPCVARWWAGCQRSAASGCATTPHTEEAMALARAVAAAYASAVERAGHRSVGGKSRPTTATAAAGTGAGVSRRTAAKSTTPRRKSGDTPRGRDAGTPSFGVGLTTPRRVTVAGQRRRRRAASSAAPPPPLPVPRRFLTAVSALSAVPCVQAELVRVLRAVLNRFPQAPLAALRGRMPAEREEGQEGGAADERATATGGGGGGDMAPPPPRPPSGKKKRRVSIEAVGLRVAASGGDSGARQTRGSPPPPLPETAPRGRERGPGSGATGSSKKMMAGRSALKVPSAFSGDSAAREAIEIVLARAELAVEYFEGPGATAADEESVGADQRGHDGGGEGVEDGEGVRTIADAGGVEPGKDGAPASRRLHLLSRHTAAVTCALRMLSPFVDAARREARKGSVDGTERRLHFGGKRQTHRSPTPRVVAITGKRSADTRKSSSAGDQAWPDILGQLADAFGAAALAASRFDFDPSTIAPGEGSRDAATATVDPPPSQPPPAVAGAAGSCMVVGVWEMLVSCATELPGALLARRLPVGGDVQDVGGGSVSRGNPRSVARLQGSVRLVAERALGSILSTGGRIGGGVGEGSASTGTVLTPTIASAPHPLKCFLLASAVWKEWGSGGGAGAGDAAGKGPRRGREGTGLRGPDRAQEEGPPKKKRARDGGSRGGDGGGGGEGNNGGGVIDDRDGDGDAHEFDVKEAFLAGLRHEGGPLVTQCAVAALSTLPLCRSKQGECLSNLSTGSGSSSSSGKGVHFTDHAATCEWKARWLPALVALCEDKDGRWPEAVRLEVATGLLRLGASLDRTARLVAGSNTNETALVAATTTATAARQQRHQRQTHLRYPGGSGGLSIPALLDGQVPAGPNVFLDMLPLWPSLLTDNSAVVRAAAARALLSAVAAAPLSRLRAAGAAGAAVLRLLTGMLACGDPEVSWVVAGGAGQFVADGGKMLRAMYRYKFVGAGRETGMDVDGEEVEDEEEEEEETLDPQEEAEREVRSREKALSRFIETIGGMLREHGDRVRLGRWQSLHEFTGLLRALG